MRIKIFTGLMYLSFFMYGGDLFAQTLTGKSTEINQMQFQAEKACSLLLENTAE